jgi:hypothetical protein
MNKFEKPELSNIGSNPVDKGDEIIAAVDDWEPLFKAVTKVEFSRGAKGLNYKSKAIVATLKDIRDGRLGPEFVTNQHKLRDKVVELINKERK